jgi:hypothetical protein
VGSEGTDAMLAIFCTLVFVGAATLAIAVITASWRQHGGQAIAIVRAARSVPDMREFDVRITVQARGRPAVAPASLRRQPRPAITRPALRPLEPRRAAA